MDLLSPEQIYAYDKFQLGENLFISGPGGSGKSFLIKYFANHLSDIERIIRLRQQPGVRQYYYQII